MDCLELVMDQCGTDQRIKAVFCIDVLLEVGHGFDHILRVRRNVSGVSECTALPADPVLGNAEFSGCLLSSADSGKQDRMGLFDKSVAERERIQTVYRVFGCLDVVYYV